MEKILEFFKTNVLFWQIFAGALFLALIVLIIVFSVKHSNTKKVLKTTKADLKTKTEELDAEHLKHVKEVEELNNKCSDLSVELAECKEVLEASESKLHKLEAERIQMASDLAAAEQTVAVLNEKIESSRKKPGKKVKEAAKKVIGKVKNKVEQADLQSIKESTEKLETLVKDIFKRDDYSVENLSKMTKDSLIKICKEHKLEGYTAFKKDELIKFINEKLGKKAK